LAKIAADLTQALADRALRGVPGQLRCSMLAAADDWSVEDVVCTSGPSDPSFEERHSRYRIAFVTAGTFQCRSPAGRELLTPGSLLVGNEGERFECGHEHGTGDRCLSFGYAPSYFERLAADAGTRGSLRLRALRVPPLRETAPLLARASAEWTRPLGAGTDTVWEELAVQLAARAIQLAGRSARSPRSPPNAESAITRAVRRIDHDPAAVLTLHDLAREAALSPYHFLRMFARLTALTPHQYVLRARLRNAATRLAAGGDPIADIAFDCGFGDVSNFNHAFRREFGVSPSAHRTRFGCRP
jgi:AraC-like DNA-binding protein